MLHSPQYAFLYKGNYKMNDLDCTELTPISVSALEGDVLLPYTMPQAEYMYGCGCTSLGMLLGYYDKYGYLGYDVSNLIDGDIAVYSRGLDGNITNMNAFDTVLGNFIASQNYVDMFYQKTPEQELAYAFNQDGTLNTSLYDCLAAWLGTGQYWRGSNDLATIIYYAELQTILDTPQEFTVEDHSLPIRYHDIKGGLYYYLETLGYSLDTTLTASHAVDVLGGDFTFEDYMAEIDAGRAVLISITNHMMVGYGYNSATREIIFDDTYRADQRMVWDGTYLYSNTSRRLEAITTIVFDTSNLQEYIPPDTEAPVISDITADYTAPTQNAVTVTATFSDNVAVTQKQYRIGDAGDWLDYTNGVLVTDNAVVYFRAFDEAGNVGEASFAITNIDRQPPQSPIVSLDFVVGEYPRAVLSAAFDEDSTKKLYSLNGEDWLDYIEELSFTEDGQTVFRAEDLAGNVSTASYTWLIEPEELPLFCIEIGSPQAGGIVLVSASANTELSVFQYSLDNGNWLDVVNDNVPLQANGSLQFKLLDTAGNAILTKKYQIDAFNVLISELQISGNDCCATVDWSEDNATQWADSYNVNLATHDAIHQFNKLSGAGIEVISASETEISLNLKPEQSNIWTNVEQPLSIAGTTQDANVLQANENNMTDIMFATAKGTWSSNYRALHTGYGNWTGTYDTASLSGKNKITDFFLGSDDASILLLTDNGDALFVDDIYSALPGQLLQQQARLTKINEIRAGAGDDLVDMTSQRFEYIGDGIVIKGGDGNDVIWANKGSNTLFGDEGDDQIIGGNDDDILIGGLGNDTMNGGGGHDTFCFCENWGQDTVTQLEGGSVTLWFANGNIDKWDANTLTYADGRNILTVTGIAAGNITLMFEDDAPQQYALLQNAGAFC